MMNASETEYFGFNARIILNQFKMYGYVVGLLKFFYNCMRKTQNKVDKAVQEICLGTSIVLECKNVD